MEDRPPPYSNDCSPPRWTPRFEQLSTESPGRLSQPLDPPPECFSTPSPVRIQFHDFPSFTIPSVSHNLADGFRLLFPSGLLEKHGIGRADWARFLDDLAIAARLAMQRLGAVGSRALPCRALLITPVPGAIYDASFTQTPFDQLKALIAVWNESAFERRRLRVSLHTKGEQAALVGYELVVCSL